MMKWMMLVLFSVNAFANGNSKSYDMLPGMTITHKGTIKSASGEVKKTLVVQTITARDDQKIYRHLRMYDIVDGRKKLTQEYDDSYAPQAFWTKTRIDEFLQKCSDEGRMSQITVGKITYPGCSHTETYSNGSTLLEWVGKVPFGNLHSEFTKKDGSAQVYDYAGTTYARPQAQQAQ